MKVFVAGATGAIGRQLVPQLVAAGHDVVGMTQSESKRELVARLGAAPAVANALDADQVARVVAEAQPEVIVHELTAIPGALNMRRFDRDFALTNRLRTEGTDHLLSAGQAIGVRRFVAQSYACLLLARDGAAVKGEDEPFDPNPVAGMRETHAALRHLEQAVTAAGGIVLRYGALYGPGTNLRADGEMTELIRKRRFPVLGDGGGMWSFVHVADAAAATVIAVQRGEPGVYHVVDDDPAPVREWLPAGAATLGAKPPMRLPLWLGRLVAGGAAVTMLTEIRAASNAKAKRVLGWQPRHPSWREGFAAEWAA